MAGITGLGTTYTLPNYTGILYALTPTETKFFSAIGGLTGGGQTTSKDFEWETFDLRQPGQNVQLEGQDAPTAQERVRANVTNLTEIHQSQVAVSYTKLAAIGAKSGINNAAQNPITNELDWQTKQELVQIVRDIEWSFINGRYNAPTDNTTTRKTRGLRQAAATVVNEGAVVVSTGLSISASGDTVAATSNGLSNGTKVYLRNNTAGGLDDARIYYVVNTATNTFKLALTSGGTAVDVTADGTADVYTPWATTLDVPTINGLLQRAYDGGGISDAGTATLMVNSSQKLAISTAYATAYGKYVESSRTVGGVAFDTLLTDFGEINVMLNRFVPQHEIIVASLDQCTPVYLEVPSKGHFFAEPLAKTGAQEKVQLYGEIGLAYGNPNAHAVLTGLVTP